MLPRGSTNEILDGAREVNLRGAVIINADIVFISLSLQKSLFTMRYAMFLKGMVGLPNQSGVFKRCRISSYKKLMSAAR